MSCGAIDVGSIISAPAVERLRESLIKQRSLSQFDHVYQVVYADPPWRYSFSQAKSRAIESHYKTMDVEDISQLRIPVAADAACFLWATAPKLVEAMSVLVAWGFDYKTHAIWDKEKIGMGYWFRGQHELLLVGIRGKVSPPQPDARMSSVIRHARGRHSSKPDTL